jgi:hypothetical protein
MRSIFLRKGIVQPIGALCCERALGYIVDSSDHKFLDVAVHQQRSDFEFNASAFLFADLPFRCGPSSESHYVRPWCCEKRRSKKDKSDTAGSDLHATSGHRGLSADKGNLDVYLPGIPNWDSSPTDENQWW